MRIGVIGGRALLLEGDDRGVDLATASQGALPSDPQAVFDHWRDVTDWVASAPRLDFEPIDPARLELPTPRPRQVFAIGANYRAHAAEAGVAPPEQPVIFTKFPSCLTGPNDSVVVDSAKVDWEAELVVVMGREARDVSRADAWSYVAGLTVGQDISERAIQRLGPMPQFCIAKSLPGFGPVGPVVVSIDEFSDTDDLALGCAVNGETMQASRTSDFIFSVGQGHASGAEQHGSVDTVGSGLPGDDAELLFDASQHAFMTADVTGHAVAHADDVTPHRLTENLTIEGGYAFDVTGRNAKDFANRIGGTVRHPATGLLHDLQRFDGCRTRVFVVVHLMLDGRAFACAEGETISLD